MKYISTGYDMYKYEVIYVFHSRRVVLADHVVARHGARRAGRNGAAQLLRRLPQDLGSVAPVSRHGVALDLIVVCCSSGGRTHEASEGKEGE